MHSVLIWFHFTVTKFTYPFTLAERVVCLPKVPQPRPPATPITYHLPRLQLYPEVDQGHSHCCGQPCLKPGHLSTRQPSSSSSHSYCERKHETIDHICQNRQSHINLSDQLSTTAPRSDQRLGNLFSVIVDNKYHPNTTPNSGRQKY